MNILFLQQKIAKIYKLKIKIYKIIIKYSYSKNLEHEESQYNGRKKCYKNTKYCNNKQIRVKIEKCYLLALTGGRKI